MPTMNQVQFAEHRGISKQAVSKMIAAGRIPVEPDGKIDPAAADAALASNADPMRAPVQQAAPSSAFTAAKTTVTEFAAKSAALKYAQESGLVVDARSIGSELRTLARQVRDRMLRLDRQMSGELAACAEERECRAIIRRHVEAALTDIATMMAGEGDPIDIAAE